MNIFVVDQDPAKCAQALDDLRLNKMIIETAQLLSTAVREHGYVGDDVYKTTHKNHPCAIWTRESSSNFEWMMTYFGELVLERFARTKKSHKSYQIVNALRAEAHRIPQGPQTPFANCSLYKNLPIFDGYKETLKTKWFNDGMRDRTPKWTGFDKPDWAK